MLTTLDEALAEEPYRKCFRLVGGVLVERTVKDVVPALQTNRDGVRILFDIMKICPDFWYRFEQWSLSSASSTRARKKNSTRSSRITTFGLQVYNAETLSCGASMLDDLLLDGGSLTRIATQKM